MNSSISPTWLICATFYVAVASRFKAYPLPTINDVAGYDKGNSMPTLVPEAVDLRIRADEIPTYTRLSMRLPLRLSSDPHYLRE